MVDVERQKDDTPNKEEKGKNKNKQVTPLKHGFAAVVSSAIATTLLQPLDVLKTRMQVQDKDRVLYRGFIASIKHIAKHEGYRGLYAGLTPSLLGNTVAWGLYFGGYRLFLKDSVSSIDQTKAAALSGVLTQTITNPIWVIKSRMQLQQRNAARADLHYKSTFDAVKVILKEEGFRGFYAGFPLSLLNNIHGVVQLVTYERIRLFMLRLDPDKTDTSKLGFFSALLAAALSKVAAQFATYPIQTVRTRIQQRPGHGLQHKSTIDAITSMWRKEGIISFYRGSLVATIRVIPHSAIIFALMEQIMHINWP